MINLIKRTAILGIINLIFLSLGVMILKPLEKFSSQQVIEKYLSSFLGGGVLFLIGIIFSLVIFILFGVYSIKLANINKRENKENCLQNQVKYFFWQYLFLIVPLIVLIYSGSGDNWGFGLIIVLPVFIINIILNIISFFILNK